MLKNYFLIALRTFRKQRGFTFLNIMGLAIGLASVMLIYLFIIDEQGFDQFHPDSDQLYILGSKNKMNGKEYSSAYAPGAWVNALKSQFPEVKGGTHLISLGYPASFRDRQKDKILLSENVFWVMSDFKEVFYFPLKYGNPETVFFKPNGIVISESIAEQFYGSQDPVGKTLELSHIYATDNKYVPLTITGVLKDYPANSHIQPDYLVSMGMLRNMMTSNGQNWQDNWGQGSGWFLSYLHTTPGADISRIVKAFNRTVQSNLPKDLNRIIHPMIMPLKDVHFTEELRSSYNNSRIGDKKYLYIFACTALLVIVIASINYMNLATARALRRSKEIGLRKVLGSRRAQLVGQFLSESLITAFIAMVIGILLVVLLLPAFNHVSGKHFSLAHLVQVKLIAFTFGTTLLVGLLSGSYPALFLSGLMPLTVLKNAKAGGRGSDKLRKGLIIMQYTITILLIVSTAIMIRQMNFIHQSALSLSGDQLLSVRWSGMASLNKYLALKQRIQEDPELDVVTLANHLPNQDYFGSMDYDVVFPEVGNEAHLWGQMSGDYDLPKAFNLQLVAGRTFKIGSAADSSTYLLNESAVKSLGLPMEKVLGMRLTINRPGASDSTRREGTVIGIVRDFPYRSIHHAISPLAISCRPDPEDRILYVKLPVGKFQEKTAQIEAKWKQELPGVGFGHWFMSEEFGRMYEGENRMSAMFKSFSILSILIACLGLFGLSSYLAEQRTKEIGIRKTLGASLLQILRLLFTPFFRLLGVACLIAIPLGWFAMNRWLQDFIYRVDIDAFIFLTSILLVALLTVFVVSYETLRAALVNPVKSLRSE
ncbi:ABC transporter permease [Dyadobacter luticola]|uniref:FtsX-like permease family protein n=1 Tax=Dyadobacter luticola TaxID=1979387 RepID=A0A5R9L0P3_9BACT|nr:FtsX-like permease family protein [Dyadobacter luticola]TLV02126.1 FtsX-like permease family protein [Dyadobacter luticola]